MKETGLKKLHIVVLCISHSAKSKMIRTENRSVFAQGWVWGRKLTTEGYKGNLEGGRNVLYLDCGDIYVLLCVSQNS